jgi:hypothetical protein
MRAERIIVENIQHLLRKRGHKQRELAEWCGHSETWLSSIFRGRTPVPHHRLRQNRRLLRPGDVSAVPAGDLAGHRTPQQHGAPQRPGPARESRAPRDAAGARRHRGGAAAAPAVATRPPTMPSAAAVAPSARISSTTDCRSPSTAGTSIGATRAPRHLVPTEPSGVLRLVGRHEHGAGVVETRVREPSAARQLLVLAAEASRRARRTSD